MKGVSNVKVESAIYAFNSIIGGEQISILGNLVTQDLNRQKGEEGPLIMPKRVYINYDTDLKSQTGNNVCFNVSELLLSYRDF